MDKTLISSTRNLHYYRGRVALYAIMKALGISEGDEVILQAFTCVAVPEAILALRAVPIYVDIQKNGVNMDTNDLRRKVSGRSKAIIVQHTFGIPADMNIILDLANKYKIPVIEDCCHALFSEYEGRSVGSFGIASFYSYEWGKPIVAGIGGSCLSNDFRLRNNLKRDYYLFKDPGAEIQLKLILQYNLFKLFYKPKLYWKIRRLFQTFSVIGLVEGNYNSIIPGKPSIDFSMKMAKYARQKLSQQLELIDNIKQHCKSSGYKYISSIHSKVVFPLRLSDNQQVVYARYPLRTDHKEKIIREAKKANIEIAGWYSTPVHPVKGKCLDLVCYKKGSCPEAEKRCNEIITLPTNLNVKMRDIKLTVDFLNSIRI